MSKSIFFHAGCSVCVSAEQELVSLISSEVEIVNLGESKHRIQEAENLGVVSVPALVTPNGSAMHINFGASIDDLK